MSESNQSPLRDELVKQNGTSSGVGAELKTLRDIVARESDRARRLAKWTKIVWVVAFVLLLVPVGMTVLYFAASQGAPPADTWSSTQPTTQISPHHESGVVAKTLKGIVATLLLMAIPVSLLLIVIGLILLVMTYFARRTVGMHEIRASLASIDAQLRMIKKE
jgi:hypothetical protein